MTSSLSVKILGRDEVFYMQKKIAMIEENENFFDEIFELFVVSKTANGVSDATLRNYHYHRKAISKYLDTNRPISEITKRDLERMIVDMKKDGIKHNSIATYVRFLRTIFNWCEAEEIAVPKLKNLKEKEVVKETYTDAELEKLLRKPKKGCDFGEYRTWVIINFLLNSGCRAATARNIKNKDVDLDGMRVVFRHNKNGKIQTIPLCSIMASILKDYMKIRKGKPDDFLFCDVYGGELTENALRHAVANYNKSRGVSSTSVHKFRHTFARKYLMDCGGNAFTLQKLMGHSTLNMTKRYCALYDADIARDYDMHSPLTQIKKDRERIARR